MFEDREDVGEEEGGRQGFAKAAVSTDAAEDYLTISYHTQVPGYSCLVAIYWISLTKSEVPVAVARMSAELIPVEIQ